MGDQDEIADPVERDVYSDFQQALTALFAADQFIDFLSFRATGGQVQAAYETYTESIEELCDSIPDFRVGLVKLRESVRERILGGR